MLGAELGEGANNISTAVLSESAGNDLEGAGEGLEGPLLGAFNFGGHFVEAASQLHLEGTTSGSEGGVDHDIAGNAEGILKVALDFVENVLRGTAEDNRASVGLDALSEEREVVVTDLVDLEKSAVSSDIGFLELFGAVNNGGSGGAGNTVVIGLTETAEDGAVSVLEELVESEIADTLLGDDDIGLDLEDGVAHALDFDFLHSEGLLEILFLGEFHVGHGLSLLVLEGAIEEHNAGVADLSAHTGVAHVLVKHDTVEHLAVLEEASGDLLNLGVALGINLNVITILHVDGADGLDSEVNNEAAPLGGELGADGGLNNASKVIVVLQVDVLANGLAHLDDVVETLEVSAHNDGGVDVTLEEGLNSAEDFTSEDNDGGGTVTDFFVLGAGKLNHRLGSGVVHVDLCVKLTFWNNLTSRRMAFPSLVRTMPPMGSRSILSMLLGPRVVRTMSDTALAALMLFC